MVALKSEEERSVKYSEHTVGFDGDSVRDGGKDTESVNESEQLQVYRDLVSQRQQLFNTKNNSLAL